MSNNWIVENIQNALDTWNDKLNEIWRLLSQSPTEFKGGTVWNVMVNINGTLKAVGYALLVLFFLMGIMKHYNSMQEIKRPEQALKLFIRFVLAKAAVTWGLDLMMAMFTIVQGIISKIMASSGIGGRSGIYLPGEMIKTIPTCTSLDANLFAMLDLRMETFDLDRIIEIIKEYEGAADIFVTGNRNAFIKAFTDNLKAMTSITAIVPSAEILTNPQTMNTRMTAIKTAISAAMNEQTRRINPARSG